MLLKVKNLSISYFRRIEKTLREYPVINGLSFNLDKGEKLALLGKSGVGKSSVALAILGLLPKNARWQGEIIYNGMPLKSSKDFQKIRGLDISIVFQQPHSYLNPILSVERQLADLLKIKMKLTNKNMINYHIEKILQSVKLPNSVRKRFPFQLSGGQAQRVAIAQSLILKPKLLIADEVTSSLDVSIRRDILDLLLSLQQIYKFALIFISHDKKSVNYIGAKELWLESLK